MVEIAAKFAALLRTRHDLIVDLDVLGLVLGLAHQRFECCRMMRGVKSADLCEVALDAFTSDEIFDPLKGIYSLASNG